MKVTHSSNSGRLSVEVEADTQVEIFHQLAIFQEVFENEVCGQCESENIRFVVRNVKDNDFYEIHCQDQKCRAKLSFGQHKKNGTLFPHRKDSEGKWLPYGGWVKYVPPVSKED